MSRSLALGGSLALSVFCNALAFSFVSGDYLCRSLGVADVQAVSLPVSLSAPDHAISGVLDFVVRDDLPFDVVLGRSWDTFCRDAHIQNPYPSVAVHDTNLSVLNGHQDPSDFLPKESFGFPSEEYDGVAFLQGSSASYHAPYAAPFKCIRNGHHLLREALTGNYCKGVHTSVFRSNAEELIATLRLHGIICNGLSLRDLKMTYLHHLFSGQCSRHALPCHYRGTKKDLTACFYLSRGFESSEEFTAVALDAIQHSNENQCSSDDLLIVLDALDLGSPFVVHSNIRQQVLGRLKIFRASQISRISSAEKWNGLFGGFERLGKAALLAEIQHHNIPLVNRFTATNCDLRNAVLQHVASGHCLRAHHSSSDAVSDAGESVDGCKHTLALFSLLSNTTELDLKLHVLRLLKSSLSKRLLIRLLDLQNVKHDASCTIEELKDCLETYIVTLSKGKSSVNLSPHIHTGIPAPEWPQLVPQKLKTEILNNFRSVTSSTQLSSSVCGSCAESVLDGDVTVVSIDDDILQFLRRPDMRPKDLVHCIADPFWLDEDCTPDIPDKFDGLLIDSNAITSTDDGEDAVKLCSACYSSLKSRKVPPLSLANHLYLGDVPVELQDLTVVEEAMIARCRTKSWIVQLREANQHLHLPLAQRGMKGHVIIYPQDPSNLLDILPPSVSDLTTPICVVFIGSANPSSDWLRDKAKPLIVRREKVRHALLWLKEHNHLYKHVRIDHDCLDTYPEHDILPVHIERVEPHDGLHSLTSRYDTNTDDSQTPSESESPPLVTGCNTESQSVFESVVVSNVDGNASLNELRIAAMRHIKKDGGGYVQVPHNPVPVNEFFNPHLFPSMYPTLFPLGIGGFETGRLTTHRWILSSAFRPGDGANLRNRSKGRGYSTHIVAWVMCKRKKLWLRLSHW